MSIRTFCITALSSSALVLGVLAASPAQAATTASLATADASATNGADVTTLPAAAAPLSWSLPKLVDRQSPLGGSVGYNGISCPTPTFCVAVGWDDDGVGYIASSTNPTGGVNAWKVVNHVDDSSLLSAISCPTTSLCVVVDAGGNVITSTNPTGDSSAWTVTDLNWRGFSDIFCPSVSLCVAVDSSGFVTTSTNPTGGAAAWSGVDIGYPTYHYGLMSVNCPSTTLCVATDFSGNVFTSANPTGDASAWTVTNIAGNHTLEDVSCPTVSMCVTVDDSGSVFTSTNPTGGAGAWTAVQLTNYGIYSTTWATMTCPSVSMCLLGEGIYSGGTSFGKVFTTTNPTGGADAWTGVDMYLANTSCPTTSLCVGDYGGTLITATAPTGGAGAWSYLHLSSGSSSITGVSCPSPTLCVAVDNAGNVLTSTNPASGVWTFAHVDGDALAPVEFVGISCPSTSLCVAVDEYGYVFTSTSPTGGASAWSGVRVDTNRLWSVSCASASLCAAGDGNGNVVWSTSPTGGAGAWTLTHIDSFSSGLTYLSGISCPANDLCVAVDGAGNHFFGNPTGGAPAWSRVQVTGATLLGISCPSTAMCISVGYAGTLGVQTATIHGSIAIDAGHALTSISCPSESLCVVTDANGNVIMSTDPTGGPTPWATVTPVDSLSALTDVSCASTTLCVAGDGLGNISVGSYVAPAPTFTVATSSALNGTTKLTFSQDVHGITSSSVQLRVDGTTTAASVSYVCRTAAAVVVTCGGYVRSVSMTPTSGRPLVPGQYYRPYVSSAVTNVFGRSVTTVAARFRASTVEQETSLAAVYGWRTVATSLAYGSSYVVEHSAGAAATYVFKGTSVVWYTITGPSQGWAYVYIDGVLKAKVNAYASSTHYRVGYLINAGGTSTSSHTLRIVVAGLKGSSAATDSQVSIDAIKVGTTFSVTPVLGLTWRSVALSVASGGRYATSDLAGAGASLTFRGKSVTWWQVMGPTQGTVRVYIDGVLKATISGYSATTKVVARTLATTDAQHTIRIVVVGTHATGSKGNSVSVDRWSIT